MTSAPGLSLLHIFSFSIAAAGVMFAFFGHLLVPDFSISTSLVGHFVRERTASIYSSKFNQQEQEHQYEVQIFSRDPLIVYIRNFVSSDEIAYLLNISEARYEPSKVYRGLDEKPIDQEMRISESAYMDRKDPVARRISKRARMFQGWRGKSTFIQPLMVQRYNVGGFYSYHLDWDETLAQENRATTFMTYLVANCTGGGTNFPFLPQPNDTRWCDVIECDAEGRDDYPGVTFKPIVGSAVFWENFYPNGTGHQGVYHAGLPVKSGTKIGLNIWSWDSAWIKPEKTA